MYFHREYLIKQICPAYKTTINLDHLVYLTGILDIPYNQYTSLLMVKFIIKITFFFNIRSANEEVDFIIFHIE